jgi:hypothetical protein
MLQALRVPTFIYEFSYLRAFSFSSKGRLQQRDTFVPVAVFIKPSLRLSALDIILSNEQGTMTCSELDDGIRIAFFSY